MGMVVFILGLIIGSFLNVCIYRIPRDESIAYPPSHCGKCNMPIKVYDLIPVISYIWLKGKCRYCKEKISLRYPLIEILTGVLFLGIYSVYGLTFDAIKYMTFTSFIIVIGIIDLDTTDVYTKTTISAVLFGIVYIFIEKFYFTYSIKTYIYAVLLSVVIIGGIILITKGMGSGDLDICIIVSLFLGFKFTAMTLTFSFIFGALIGSILIILKKKNRKDYIAFGPFIAMASMVVILFGDKIFLFYISLF